MSRDPLSNPYLLNKLAKAQGELASGVKPGSVPHPRRVLRQAAKEAQLHGEAIGRPSKPSNPRRRKQKNKHTPKGRSTAAPSSSRKPLDEAGGETQTGRELHPGEEEEEVKLEEALERAKEVMHNNEDT